MTDVVHLLWFAKEMPEGEDDIERIPLLSFATSAKVTDNASVAIPHSRLPQCPR